jgi:hypothetical protein
MGKKPSKGIPDSVQIPIHWNSEGMPVVFANQMLVNMDEHEVHLHFYEIAPPVIYGSDEQRQKQIESLSSVTARGVVRVILSKDRLPAVIEALQTIAHRIAEKKSPQNGAKERKSK